MLMVVCDMTRLRCLITNVSNLAQSCDLQMTERSGRFFKCCSKLASLINCSIQALYSRCEAMKLLLINSVPPQVSWPGPRLVPHSVTQQLRSCHGFGVLWGTS